MQILRTDANEQNALLPFIQSIEDCSRGKLNGAVIDRRLAETRAVLARLADQSRSGSLPHFTVPYRSDDLGQQMAVADRIASECNQVVLLGTGGSSLGPQAIAQLVQTPFGGPADRPRLGFLDNLDSVSLEASLATGDVANTHFLVASKSGSTAETIAQLLVVIDALEQAGFRRDSIGRRFTVITEPRDNLLRNLAHRFGATVLDHDPDLGGRFAVLSVIGTMPALILGLDPMALRRGAARTLEQNVFAEDPALAPAAVGAAVSVAAADCGLPQSVFFGYSDRLERLGAWWRQLWAESLGKQGKGTTPITAIGPVDQHSQLQLYLDGPADKLFTVVDLATKGQGAVIRQDLADDPSLAFLSGRPIGDVVAAQARATADTLVKFDRPVRRLTIPQLDVESLGSLFMHFMLETIIAAALLEVDPFDQPAVEDGKILTRQYLMQDGI
ncbi:glucose-6-phosphate isomerase [Zavarzinia compransoris]|uniref:glucose-6-phosphate isomerase n=1 Tax=Zavarzinia marina TaxID=2911065 RepID=UPI001F483A82|nr:glucose-6-phosphate isomerase [Zavarzinia marina]MCF4164729.1 glucose-6-phosphate isomerase [Zavarzinia marina]